MGPAMQAKLLRVLQEGEFLPVGGNAAIRVDVRVVSATHRDLRVLIRDGKFREDLFYRIHAARIDLPPLRERREDVPLLVDHFLAALAAEDGPGSAPREIEPAAVRHLQSYRWPGNVRELQHLLTRVSALVRGPSISLGDLERYGELVDSTVQPDAPPVPLPSDRGGSAGVESLQSLEQRQILRAVAEAR